ncbi:rCG54796 [Rattus norvegicus]|uniref:RCG54796 n=1 Tax=Rattus norvegicus TaxID=10116 RepID=A6IIR4_RAT|nr:rCG54796 [Rattus norvegicus]
MCPSSDPQLLEEKPGQHQPPWSEILRSSPPSPESFSLSVCLSSSFHVLLS